NELILGQGFGGRFIAPGPFGSPVLTGWSHVFPLWIVLKVGIIGLGVLLAAGGVSAWRLIRQGRERRGHGVALGAVIVVGIMAMSLTLGRAALPDGAMLLGLAAALLTGVQDAPSPSTRAPRVLLQRGGVPSP